MEDANFVMSRIRMLEQANSGTDEVHSIKSNPSAGKSTPPPMYQERTVSNYPYNDVLLRKRIQLAKNLENVDSRQDRGEPEEREPSIRSERRDDVVVVPSSKIKNEVQPPSAQNISTVRDSIESAISTSNGSETSDSKMLYKSRYQQSIAATKQSLYNKFDSKNQRMHAQTDNIPQHEIDEETRDSKPSHVQSNIDHDDTEERSKYASPIQAKVNRVHSTTELAKKEGGPASNVSGTYSGKLSRDVAMAQRYFHSNPDPSPSQKSRGVDHRLIPSETRHPSPINPGRKCINHSESYEAEHERKGRESQSPQLRNFRSSSLDRGKGKGNVELYLSSKSSDVSVGFETRTMRLSRLGTYQVPTRTTNSDLKRNLDAASVVMEAEKSSNGGSSSNSSRSSLSCEELGNVAKRAMLLSKAADKSREVKLQNSAISQMLSNKRVPKVQMDQNSRLPKATQAFANSNPSNSNGKPHHIIPKDESKTPMPSSDVDHQKLETAGSINAQTRHLSRMTRAERFAALRKHNKERKNLEDPPPSSMAPSPVTETQSVHPVFGYVAKDSSPAVPRHTLTTGSNFPKKLPRGVSSNRSVEEVTKNKTQTHQAVASKPARRFLDETPPSPEASFDPSNIPRRTQVQNICAGPAPAATRNGYQPSIDIQSLSTFDRLPAESVEDGSVSPVKQMRQRYEAALIQKAVSAKYDNTPIKPHTRIAEEPPQRTIYPKMEYRNLNEKRLPDDTKSNAINNYKSAVSTFPSTKESIFRERKSQFAQIQSQFESMKHGLINEDEVPYRRQDQYESSLGSYINPYLKPSHNEPASTAYSSSLIRSSEHEKSRLASMLAHSSTPNRELESIDKSQDLHSIIKNFEGLDSHLKFRDVHSLTAKPLDETPNPVNTKTREVHSSSHVDDDQIDFSFHDYRTETNVGNNQNNTYKIPADHSHERRTHATTPLSDSHKYMGSYHKDETGLTSELKYSRQKGARAMAAAIPEADSSMTAYNHRSSTSDKVSPEKQRESPFHNIAQPSDQGVRAYARSIDPSPEVPPSRHDSSENVNSYISEPLLNIIMQPREPASLSQPLVKEVVKDDVLTVQGSEQSQDSRIEEKSEQQTVSSESLNHYVAESHSSDSQGSKPDALRWWQRNYGKVSGITNAVVRKAFHKRKVENDLAPNSPKDDNEKKITEQPKDSIFGDDDEDDIFFGLDDESRVLDEKHYNVHQRLQIAYQSAEANIRRRNAVSISNERDIQQKPVEVKQRLQTAERYYESTPVEECSPPRRSKSVNVGRSGMVLDEARAITSVTSDITTSLLAGKRQRASRYKPDRVVETIQEESHEADEAEESHFETDDNDEGLTTVLDSVAPSSSESVAGSHPPGMAFLNIGCAIVDSISNVCRVPGMFDVVRIFIALAFISILMICCVNKIKLFNIASAPIE
jgi:hypothetical protein